MFLNSVPHKKFQVIKHDKREVPGLLVPNINAVFHNSLIAYYTPFNVLSFLMFHCTVLALGNAMHGLTSPLPWLEMIEIPQNELSTLLMQISTIGFLLYCGSKRGVVSELPKRRYLPQCPCSLAYDLKFRTLLIWGKYS